MDDDWGYPYFRKPSYNVSMVEYDIPIHFHGRLDRATWRRVVLDLLCQFDMSYLWWHLEFPCGRLPPVHGPWKWRSLSQCDFVWTQKIGALLFWRTHIFVSWIPYWQTHAALEDTWNGRRTSDHSDGSDSRCTWQLAKISAKRFSSCLYVFLWFHNILVYCSKNAHMWVSICTKFIVCTKSEYPYTLSKSF